MGYPTHGWAKVTWQVIGAQNSDDLYIAARGMMSETKLSLHQSGVWRYAFTKTVCRETAALGIGVAHQHT